MHLRSGLGSYELMSYPLGVPVTTDSVGISTRMKIEGDHRETYTLSRCEEKKRRRGNRLKGVGSLDRVG